jgi:hypothetical protein
LSAGLGAVGLPWRGEREVGGLGEFGRWLMAGKWVKCDCPKRRMAAVSALRGMHVGMWRRRPQYNSGNFLWDIGLATPTPDGGNSFRY